MDTYKNIRCINHPEREFAVAFHRPGVSVKCLCQPCADEYRKAVQTEYKGKREAWEYGDENRERDRQRSTYGISDYDIGNDSYNRSPERMK